jgi:hypothetical protein
VPSKKLGAGASEVAHGAEQRNPHKENRFLSSLVFGEEGAKKDSKDASRFLS